MRMRSLLFVPGDSDRKLSKSSAVAADVLILDLEDSVAADAKDTARSRVQEFLQSRPVPAGRQLWVRINPLDHPDAGADLAAVMPARPDGIVLPKARGPEDVEMLGHRIGTYEAEYELDAGATRIFPVATETPGMKPASMPFSAQSMRSVRWVVAVRPSPGTRRQMLSLAAILTSMSDSILERSRVSTALPMTDSRPSSTCTEVYPSRNIRSASRAASRPRRERS